MNANAIAGLRLFFRRVELADAVVGRHLKKSRFPRLMTGQILAASSIGNDSGPRRSSPLTESIVTLGESIVGCPSRNCESLIWATSSSLGDGPLITANITVNRV